MFSSVSSIYSLCLSHTVYVCPRQFLFVTKSLFLSQTVCDCHKRSVSVTDGLCLWNSNNDASFLLSPLSRGRVHGCGCCRQWHKTCDTWHMVPDTWYLIPDTGHLTPDTGNLKNKNLVFICSTNSSHWDFQYLL